MPNFGIFVFHIDRPHIVMQLWSARPFRGIMAATQHYFFWGCPLHEGLSISKTLGLPACGPARGSTRITCKTCFFVLVFLCVLNLSLKCVCVCRQTVLEILK